MSPPLSRLTVTPAVVAALLTTLLVPAKSVVAAEPRHRAGAIEIRGRIVAVAGDPKTAAAGESVQNYSLATADGVVDLGVDASTEPAVLAAVGSRATVRGTPRRGGQLDVLTVQPNTNRLTSARLSNPVTGSQRWATLLCRFAGDPSVPHAMSWYEGLVGGETSFISDYFEETSYGSIDLAGTTVMSWVDLPRTRASYGPPASADLSAMAQDCADANDTAGLDFRDYVGIDMHFNQDMTYSWGGSVYLNLDGAHRVWKATWMSNWGNAGVQAHEMGHGLGLLHSSGPYAQTYDSRWDQMSNAYAGPADPTYGSTPEGTISYHRDYLGWLQPSWVTTVARGASVTTTLRPLSDPVSAGGQREIVIAISGTVFYTVEARERTGADVGVPGDAVVIHQVDESRRSSSPFDRVAQVVDADGNGNVNDAGAMWTQGEAFGVPALDLTVTVDALAADGSYKVSVANGLPDPTPPINPTTFTSSSHSVGIWSSDDTIAVTIAGASDADSGLNGYSVAWGGAAVTADTTKDLGASAVSFVSAPQPDGDRHVALRTVDAAGNWSSQIVAGPFPIDATSPLGAVTVQPASPFTWSTSIPVTWNGGSDAGSGVAGVDVRFRKAMATAVFGEGAPWLTATALPGATFHGKLGRTYCFGVRGVDAVGNRSVWSAERCTAVPLDDRALVARNTWTRRATGTFMGTTSTTRLRGARLVVGDLQSRRFALMADTCPTCGRFRVIWRGRVIARVDLSSAVPKDGVVFPIRTMGRARSGVLVLEVISAGALVSIDAVGVSRV